MEHNLSEGVVCQVHQAQDEVVAGCLCIIHGLGDHSTYQMEVVEARPTNFACVALDLPGHGKSEGVRGHIDDFKVYDDAVDLAVEYAHETFGGIVVVWGSSMGGLLALRRAVRSQREPVVASAPLLRVPVNFAIRQVIRFGAALSPTTAISVNSKAIPPCHGVCTLGWLRQAGIACDDFDPKNIKEGPPLLLQIGTKDPMVKVADVKEVGAQAQRKEVVVKTYRGRGHEPFHENDEQYFKDLKDFLLKL